MNTTASLAARQNMLKSQILTGNVLAEPLLDALMGVPREAFVPAQFQGVAYIDEEVPLGQGRFLMEPLAFAKLVNTAQLTHESTVLVVGCGTGYSAAVLAMLAGRVVAVEENPALCATAKKNLATLANVLLAQAPLVDGVHQHAPYDAILIEGAIEYVPQTLADQLKEGGRMLAFERDAKQHVGTSGLTNLVEYRKIKNALYRTVICNASVAPLTAFNKPQAFTF